ncbi:MAG: heavy metal translocating P-type ATPase [Bacilli bacterium]|jgi:Cu+-exporting ATPase|nr:heavy metal translocating P-type ATPase [Bacilli bacterium]HKM10424.1 heavy metal translocating P-type ATPase [Bacilli bacterium]
MKKKHKFLVKGMTCSACQAHVEHSVNKIHGVDNVVVNLISNTLEYESDVVSDKTIMDAVKRAGYQAVPFQKIDYRTQEKNKGKSLIISLVLLVFLLYVAMGPMINLPLPPFLTDAHGGMYLSIAQFILLIPIVILNFRYFTSGFNKLFRLKPNMDSLVALGSTASILYSIYSSVMIIISTTRNQPEMVHHFLEQLYFDGAGTILTLVSLGKYIEFKSKRKTSNAISDLLKLQGDTAIIVKGEKEMIIDIKDIQVGDTIKLMAGYNAPVDGIIKQGHGSFNESSLTGESLPVFHQEGDNILSGVTNLDGFILYEATSTSANSTIARIVEMVSEASSSKAPIAKVVDKVSLIFVPIVLGLSLITLVVWWIFSKSFEQAISFAIPVLVISCPCALGLATPIAIMISTGMAAKNHILIHNAEALENLSKIKTIVMDKTGTLTKGDLMVTQFVSFNNRFAPLLYGMEKASSHPLAKAIIRHSEEELIPIVKFDEVITVPGKGLKGKYQNQTLYAGNAAYIKEATGLDFNYETSHSSCVILASEKEILGYVLINDSVKDSSIQAIKAFQKEGIKTVMLTGDNKENAHEMNKLLHIDEIIAEVLPDQKAEIIRSYQKDGMTLMVGDGINDAVALEVADVSMAIGAGSDIAIKSSDLVLVKDDLFDAYRAYKLSKRTMRNIKMNLFWAFFYNVVSIPIAMGALYPSFQISLDPMIAALAMTFSSVFVVLSASTLFIEKKAKKS